MKRNPNKRTSTTEEKFINERMLKYGAMLRDLGCVFDYDDVRDKYLIDNGLVRSRFDVLALKTNDLETILEQFKVPKIAAQNARLCEKRWIMAKIYRHHPRGTEMGTQEMSYAFRDAK